jgi:hypothetical protein
VLKLPQPKTWACCYSTSIAFLSLDDIKCDINAFVAESSVTGLADKGLSDQIVVKISPLRLLLPDNVHNITIWTTKITSQRWGLNIKQIKSLAYHYHLRHYLLK